MTNKINNIQIDSSIEMKDKWVNSILKKSRKLTSLEKFYDRITTELGIEFKYININKLFISEKFLKSLKESDSEDLSSYHNFSPKTSKDIDAEDFTIYLLEGFF